MPAKTQITLDKSDPDVADAFQGCKPGDTYRVVSDDENTIVLEPAGAGGEYGPETAEDEEAANADQTPAGEQDGGEMTTDEAEPEMASTGNPAVDRLMRKKEKY